MAARWTRAVVVLVGLAVAAAIFVWLGSTWWVTYGADDWGCGTVFDPADYETHPKCPSARTDRMVLEIGVAVLCGFAAAALAAHLVSKSNTADTANTVSAKDW
jgi:hypothetical protein